MTFGRRKAISEIGHVSKIYVRQRAFDFGEVDLIEAVDGFVERMKACLYLPDELPQEAIYSLAVHDFLCKDCGSQYVMNSRWESDRVAAVRAGLMRMGALEYLEYFEWLAGQVDAMKSDIDRLFRTGGNWDQAIRDALNHRARHLQKLQREKPIIPLIANFLKRLPNLQPMENAAYDMKMYELVESVPDYRNRLQARLHEGHWVTQMVRILSLKAGQRLHWWGAPTVIDLKNTVGALKVMLTRGEYRVTLYSPDRAELRDLEGKLIAAVDIKETKPHDQRRLN